jgi:outer membrane biosynthesis protein TonB
LLVPHQVEEKSKEEPQRIKVSLKERPKAKSDALVKNDLPPAKALPLPKGEQLKKIIKKPFIQPKKPPEPSLKKKPEQQPKKEPIAPNKPYLKSKPAAKPVEKKENSSDLYALLSKPSEFKTKEAVKHDNTQSSINQDIQELYGDTFAQLSAGEQKYILDNQEIMRRITQQVLNRVGSVNLRGDLRVNASNIIEFYLHPNGDISDIHLIQKSSYFILDHTTEETIEYAYSKYPRPDQKTLIRYKVGYYLRGY